jgi:hypothetical protein
LGSRTREKDNTWNSTAAKAVGRGENGIGAADKKKEKRGGEEEETQTTKLQNLIIGG